MSGGPLDAIRDEVGRVFKLDGPALDRMLTGRPVVVSRSTTAEAAAKLLERLHKLDLEARSEPLPGEPVVGVKPAVISASPASLPDLPGVVEPPAVEPKAPEPDKPAVTVPATGHVLALVDDTPPTPGEGETVCPKCGELQPKRTLCRKCGLDMPRYAAAQAEAEREARVARQATAAAPAKSAGRMQEVDYSSFNGPPGLLGLGFSGRIGRLDYLSSSFICWSISLLFVTMALKTSSLAVLILGLLLTLVYAFRCVVLRLHDTDHTGWFSLLMLIPLVGGVMGLFLLFFGGTDGDNEFGGPPNDGGGLRLIGALLLTFLFFSLATASIAKDPELAARFGVPTRGVGPKVIDLDAPGNDAAAGAVSGKTGFGYASDNRIDLYVAAGCTTCDNMRAWLDGNQLHYTLYRVDNDQMAADRLHSMLGAGESVNLPVLEINGRVLPGNPGLGLVHRALRPAR